MSSDDLESFPPEAYQKGHVGCIVRGRFEGWRVQIVTGTYLTRTLKLDRDFYPASFTMDSVPSYPSRTEMEGYLVVDVRITGRGQLPPPKRYMKHIWKGVPISFIDPLLAENESFRPVSKVEASLFGFTGLKINYGNARLCQTHHDRIPFRYRSNPSQFVQFEAITSPKRNYVAMNSCPYSLLVFLDLEATGLVVQSDHVTEVAASARLWNGLENRWDDSVWDNYEGIRLSDGQHQATKKKISPSCSDSKADEGDEAPTACPRELPSVLPSYSQLVKPDKSLGESWRITPPVIALTGISNELLERDGVPFKEACDGLEHWVSQIRKSCPKGTKLWLVAHNGWGYDVPLLQNNELRLASMSADAIPWLTGWWGDASEASGIHRTFFGTPYVIPEEASSLDDSLLYQDDCLTCAETGQSLLSRLGVDVVLDTLMVSRRLIGWVKEEDRRRPLSSNDTDFEDLDRPSSNSLSYLHMQVQGERIEQAHRALADVKALMRVCDSLTLRYIFTSGAPIGVDKESFVIEKLRFKKVKHYQLEPNRRVRRS